MLVSGLPETVADEEDLARFLTQSSHFNSTMAKPAAFLPSRKSRETSVSRHGGEPVETLWMLGAHAQGERKLHGAAIMKAAVVRAAGLEVSAAEPPPRHAALRRWPWDDGDPALEKARQKEVASVLAGSAAIILR